MNTLFKYFHRLLPAIAFGLLMLCLPVLEGCRKTDPGPDPCLLLKPTNADFAIKQRLGERGGDTLIETDQVVEGSSVYFYAKDTKGTKCTWIIGEGANIKVAKDTLFELRAFLGTGQVKVRLVVEREKVNSGCFPDDDGVDTVAKIINIVEGGEKSRMLGDYEGYLEDNPNERFTVNISYGFDRYENYISYFLRYLPKDCIDSSQVADYYQQVDCGGKHLYTYYGIPGTKNCKVVSRFGVLKNEKDIEIEVRYYNKKTQKFIGTKKN